MNFAQLEKRLLALEEEVKRLKGQVTQRPGSIRRRNRENAGEFANDPLFDEMVRLTRLRPRQGERHRVADLPAACFSPSLFRVIA